MIECARDDGRYIALSVCVCATANTQSVQPSESLATITYSCVLLARKRFPIHIRIYLHTVAHRLIDRRTFLIWNTDQNNICTTLSSVDCTLQILYVQGQR